MNHFVETSDGESELYNIESRDFLSLEESGDDWKLRLYFLDEFVSMSGFGTFRELMLRARADARFWIQENSFADRTLVPPALKDGKVPFIGRELLDEGASLKPPRDCESNCDLGPVERAAEELSASPGDGLTVFRTPRTSFFTVCKSDDLEHFQYISALPVKDPYILQEIPADLAEDAFENPRLSKRIYGVFKTPQVRYGLFTNPATKASLLRFNVFAVYDEEHFRYPRTDSLAGKYKAVYRDYGDILKYAAENYPAETLPFFRKDVLGEVYSSPWASAPSKTSLQNSLRTVQNPDGTYEIFRRSGGDSRTFYRYFGWCRPILTPAESLPVELWKAVHRRPRLSLNVEPLVKNETDTPLRGSHAEEYYSSASGFSGVRVSKAERKIWEDKWFNDSRIMYLPETAEYVYGRCGDAELARAEADVRKYFDKRFTEAGYADEELRNYLFFRYKAEFDVTPAGAENGQPEYQLVFRFRLI